MNFLCINPTSYLLMIYDYKAITLSPTQFHRNKNERSGISLYNSVRLGHLHNLNEMYVQCLSRRTLLCESLSAACPPMHENSCSWQPLLPLTRTSNSQQGQCVCLCAGSQRRRWPGTFLQGIEHVFLSFVYASLMLGGSEATRRARWKARQSRVLHSYIFATTHCCFYPFFCEWLFTEAARSLT